MRNLCGKGKQLTKAVNDESVQLTKSSRSLDTRPLRAFIITSICSFIASISVTTSGEIISMRDRRLIFCHFGLLGALLPSSPSRSRHSALVPSWSSSWLPCPAFLWRNYFSKSWFYLMRCSMAAARVCTCLSRAVAHGSSPWTLLVVTIDQVSTMQLFIREAFAMTYKSTTKSFPTDDVNWWCRKSHQWATRYSHTRNSTCTIKREDLTESTGVVPAKYSPKVKLELLTTLEC